MPPLSDYFRPIQRLTYRTTIPKPIRPARIATTKGRLSAKTVPKSVVNAVKIVPASVAFIGLYLMISAGYH